MPPRRGAVGPSPLERQLEKIAVAHAEVLPARSRAPKRCLYATDDVLDERFLVGIQRNATEPLSLYELYHAPILRWGHTQVPLAEGLFVVPWMRPIKGYGGEAQSPLESREEQG